VSHDDLMLVRDMLTERAERVAPPAVGLAGRARDRARVRRRNQGLGVLAVTVAAAAAVVTATAVPGTHERAGEGNDIPAHPDRNVVTLAVPEGVTTSIDPDLLAAGRPPEISWWSWRSLHRTDGRVVRLPDGAAGAVEAPDGGALVTGGTIADPTLAVVDAVGRASPPFRATDPVVGPDGQVAYVDLERHLVVRDRPGGSGGAVTVPFPDDGVVLVGFLGDGVVANSPTGSARVIKADGATEPVRGQVFATATDAGSGTIGSRSEDRRCLELRRNDGLLWRSCDNPSRFDSIVDISPDGLRVLVRRDRLGGAGTSEYAVVGAGTGRVQRAFGASGTGLGLGQAVFERDDTVLLAAYHGGTVRIVRCHLTGACEVAGEQGGTQLSPTPFRPAWVP
jgi:hypothetical protein